MSMSGSKIREQVAHFLVDIHTGIIHIRDSLKDLIKENL